MVWSLPFAALSWSPELPRASEVALGGDVSDRTRGKAFDKGRIGLSSVRSFIDPRRGEASREVSLELLGSEDSIVIKEANYRI